MKQIYYNYQDPNDQDQVVLEIAFSETHDAFICAPCLDEGVNFTHLHATEGGNILPILIKRSRKTIRSLRREKCLICDLPVSRSID